MEEDIDEEKEIEMLRYAEEQMSWIHKNYKDMQKKYAGRYIAVRDKSVISSGKSLKKVLENINKRGIDLDEVVIEYIFPKNTALIL